MTLGLSIDEMDDLEDELLVKIEGISFIAAEDFISRHGDSFAIFLEDNQFTLKADAP